MIAMNAEVSVPARLADYARVCTASVDDAAEAIGRIFCPHDLKPVDHSTPGFSAQHNCADFDGFSINYVAYGGSVSIDPGCLDRFFLLQMPLQGYARVRTAAREVATGPGRIASLLSPTVPTHMTWHHDCAQLILLIERRVVEQRAAALAGTPVKPVEFEPSVDLTASVGATLHGQVEHLITTAERLGPAKAMSPLASANWRETLLGALLNGQRHSSSHAIDVFNGRLEAQPAALRRARAWLEAQAAEPLDLEQLADIAGTGIRALQIGFRRHFGKSISEMLQDIRLAQLSARLKTARPDERIVDIAFDLGFTHLSRMASSYRAKFGESPSSTLRRLS